MLKISRRGFLSGAIATGAAAMAGGRLLAAAAPTATKGTDLVTLGKSRLKPTLLGIGTGTRGGSEQLAIGQAEFTKMVRHALDRGIRYIDTADRYQTHLFVRLALKGVPRERYFIQTKTTARHPEVAKADINRFRRELRVDTIDSLLMHCMTKEGWPTDMRPVMDELLKAKERGHVKAIGISCHGFPPLAAAVGCDWCDIQLARINPFGIQMDGKPDKVAAELKKMHVKGRGVIGMKVFGETGYDSAEKRLQALRYVLNLGCVDCFTIGFTSAKQIDETLDLIEKAGQASVGWLGAPHAGEAAA